MISSIWKLSKDEGSHRLGGLAINKNSPKCNGQGSGLARVTKFAKLSARAVRLSRYRIGPRSKGIELHPDVSTYGRDTHFATSTGTLGIPPF